MGWSWALYFANETVATRIAAAGGTPGDAIRERQPAPSFSEHPSLTGTYVDNICIIGRTRTLAASRSERIEGASHECRLPLDWTEPEPVTRLGSLGLRGRLRASGLLDSRLRTH